MNEHEFDEALERGFAGMRARRGACPSAEELAAYETEAVQAHVALCGTCDAIVVRLKKFEEAAREERIRAKVFPRRRARAVLAMAGWAVAAGVLVGAYLGVKPAAPGWGAVETIDLNRARGAQAALTASGSSQFVILSFLVDIRPDLPYEATLDGGEAKRISSYDQVGNFHLVVDRRLLAAGRHVLRVREGEARTVEFPFEVK